MQDANAPTPPSTSAPNQPSRGKDIARIVFATVVKFLGTLIAIAVTLGAGIWSARSLIETGSMVAVTEFGPWHQWPSIATPGADPYTRAHLARSGEIAIAGDSAGTFQARADDDGARLHSSCDYIIEGPPATGLWWSLAVYNGSGELIENDAKRYAFTSDTVAPNPDGSFIVSLGRDARPGNWLPTGRAGRLVLVFTLLDPATGFSTEQRAGRSKFLPLIRREGCS